MFEKIRKPGRFKSIFAYFVFALIIFIFIFIGVPLNFSTGGYAARINKRVISLAQFQQALNRVESNKTPSAPENATRQAETQREVLRSLINREIFYQNAIDQGLNVSDSELRDYITSIKAFQDKKGRFKSSTYLTYLQSSRMVASDFEDQVKQDILVTRVRKGFDYALRFSGLELDQNTLLDSYKFNFKYVKILLPPQNAEKEIKKWSNYLTDSARLDQALKEQGLQWIDSAQATLRNIKTVIPQLIDSDSFFQQTLQVYPKGLFPRLQVLSDGNILIAYLDSAEIKKDTSKYVQMSQSLRSSFVSEIVLLSWLEHMRTRADISINPAIFTNIQ